MLNVDTIKNGLVIDHIRAGLGPAIFSWLGLDRVSYSAALIMNVASPTMGKKDIIKVDNIINMDYSVLGFIDPNITVNVVKDEVIVRKIRLSLPDRVENVIKCKNPRCITSTEPNVPHVFRLVSRESAQYRCEYCDELHHAGIGSF
ncbi:MAG: aspartate carbamoyltransferase regulatory subunit [Spirochaetaceae bacterium]|jgi:aspartate carbamoyltransferase regulatory subunit|nr:aspartate carbamoyltransferase regulatory subunit [Spirochaetaceae bacterium]